MTKVDINWYFFQQAIDWINELCDVMVTTHTDMGQSAEEAEALHEEHKKFEATALVSLALEFIF